MSGTRPWAGGPGLWKNGSHQWPISQGSLFIPGLVLASSLLQQQTEVQDSDSNPGQFIFGASGVTWPVSSLFQSERGLYACCGSVH